MSTDPVIDSIQYHKRTDNILNDAMFTLDFKNSDSIMLALGTVLRADIGIDYLKTEELRAGLLEGVGSSGGPIFYVARDLSMAIDCSYLPPIYVNRIRSLKDLSSVRIKIVRFSDDGMCRTFPNSCVYFTPDFFNETENMYQTIEDGDEDVIWIKIDEPCDYRNQ